jgi:hypothetical protein
MNNLNFSELNVANSTLKVCASGSICDVSSDMNCPETKTIAQLLHEEKKITNTKPTS